MFNLEKLVSIIIPTYNCGQYILDTLISIQNQTYTNFEALIIDDYSTDNTYEVIKGMLDNDKRFIYTKLETNSGAAMARNKGVELANGTYIAFLDSDDVWTKEKLEKQVKFMSENNYSFSSTVYGRIDQYNNKINWLSKYIPIRNYNKVLKRCPGNSTVMYNADTLGKTYIPDIKKRNDYVMWLSIIKKAKYIYEMEETLTYYRIREDSLSRDKKTLIKYHWYVYRKIEKLSVIKSAYLIWWYIFKAIFKL